GDDLVVLFAIVVHAHQGNGSHLDDTPREGRILHQNEHVEGVLVVVVGLGDKAVIVGIVDVRVEHAVQDHTGNVLVVFVFVAFALETLDHGVDRFGGVRAGFEVRPEVYHHHSSVKHPKSIFYSRLSFGAPNPEPMAAAEPVYRPYRSIKTESVPFFVAKFTNHSV